MIFKNSKHITKFVNYYHEKYLYLTIFGGDEKKEPRAVYVMGGLHIICLVEMLFDIIKQMYQHIFKKVLKGLGDSIASQIWTSVKLKFGKNINEVFESQSSKTKCIMIGFNYLKKNCTCNSYYLKCTY